MGELHGGQIVAKYLKEVEEVDTVFSLTGGHITPIYDGCPDYGVRLIDVRHEQAAVMMAHAWSIYTGKPGVCLVTAARFHQLAHRGGQRLHGEPPAGCHQRHDVYQRPRQGRPSRRWTSRRWSTRW